MGTNNYFKLALIEPDLIFNIKEEEQCLKLREYLRNIQKLSGRLIRDAVLNWRIKVNDNVVKLNLYAPLKVNWTPKVKQNISFMGLVV